MRGLYLVLKGAVVANVKIGKVDIPFFIAKKGSVLNYDRVAISKKS